MRTLLLILLMIGAVLLEMYLSRKPSRWPGLVLPITAFVTSLIYPLNMANLGVDADCAGTSGLAAGQHTHLCPPGHILCRPPPHEAHPRAEQDERQGPVNTAPAGHSEAPLQEQHKRSRFENRLLFIRTSTRAARRGAR